MRNTAHQRIEKAVELLDRGEAPDERESEQLLEALDDLGEDYRNAGLSEQEGRVAVLKTHGFTHLEAAELLGISKSGVAQAVRRIREKYQRSHDLITAIERSGLDEVLR